MPKEKAENEEVTYPQKLEDGTFLTSDGYRFVSGNAKEKAAEHEKRVAENKKGKK